MLINVVSREYWHSLISGHVILDLHKTPLIIFLIWFFWAIQEIILEHLFIMNRLCWIQEDNRRLLYFMDISRVFLFDSIDDISEGLDTVESSCCLKNKLKASLTTKVLRLSFNRHCNFLGRCLLQIIKQSAVAITVAWLVLFHEDVWLQLFNSSYWIRHIFSI